MYVRGSDKNIEYKRDLNGFFRGIIMDDADPSKFYRCKIFIPEIHGAVDLVEGEETVKYYISPDKIGSLKPNVHQRLLEILPWAEQASSLFGELSLSHYKASIQEQTGGTKTPGNRDKPPTDKQGAQYPSEKLSRMAKGSPGDGNAFNPNSAASVYLPAQNDPSAHGIHGVPSVGAHVWVFFDRGDINCPVYIAGCPPASEALRVYRDNQYPDGYSSFYGQDGGVKDTPPEPKPLTGAPSTPGETFDGSQYQPTVYGTAFEGGTPENPFGNGRTLDLTTKLETGRTAKDAIDREKYGLRQIPVDWQFIGTRNNTLIPGYHIAVDRVDGVKWPRGTILNINGSNYEVADRAGNHIRNKYGRGPIDFYAGNDRELYDKFRNIKIESVEVVRVGPGTS